MSPDSIPQQQAEQDRRPGRDFGGRQVSVARSTFTVLAANVASTVFGAVRSLYLARTMLPADYGIWSLVTALLSYANYADLGINTGFIIRVSTLLGRGESAEADRVQRHALTATLLIPGAVATIVLIASFLPTSVVGGAGSVMRVVAAAILVLAFLNYAQVVARIDDRWRRIGVSSLATAVVAMTAVIVVGTSTGYVTVTQAAVAVVTGSLVAALILFRRRPVRFAWPPDAAIVRRLVTIGLPVSLFPIGLVLFQSIDRWIVAGGVPSTELGFYGLGTTLGGFLYMVPTTLAVILFTRQIADFGATGNPSASESLVLPPIQLSAYLMAYLAGGALLGLPYVVMHLTPAYGPALQVAGLQVAGNCLLFSIPVGANYLISIERQRVLFVLLAAATVIEVGLVYACVAMGWGIRGAAWAVVVSDVAFSMTVSLACFLRFGHGPASALRQVVRCFLPFSLCLPVAMGLRYLLPMNGSALGDAVVVAGYFLVYGVLAGLLCLVAARTTGLFRQPFLAVRLRTWLPTTVATALIGH